MSKSSFWKQIFKADEWDKYLYLIAVLGLLAIGLDLQNKISNIEELSNSLRSSLPLTQDEDHSKEKAFDPPIVGDLKRNLSPYYCGLFKEQVFTFRFEPHGRLKVWVQHSSIKGFTFPPITKPQYLENYHFKNSYLYWTVNLFGEPFHFKAPMGPQLKQGQKQLVLKSGDSFFSPYSCEGLAELL